MAVQDVDRCFTNGSIRPSNGANASGEIIDIRRDKTYISLSGALRTCLRGSKTSRPSFPAMLLWGKQGLEMFDAVTQLEDYYVFHDEVSILKQRSRDIAQKIKPSSMIIDLGSGGAQKIRFLLRALNSLGRTVDYYAVDLCSSSIQKSLDAISSDAYTHIRYHGLLGTYDDAFAWLQLPQNISRPKCVLSLGSSIGNFAPLEAVGFLVNLAKALRGPEIRSGREQHDHHGRATSHIIVGLDTCKSGEKVRRAYDDAKGLNARFILSALHEANTVLGVPAFRSEEWKVRCEWHDKDGCLTQYLVPLRDITVEGIALKAGASIPISQSYKYGPMEKARLWRAAGLKELEKWNCADGYVDISMMEVDCRSGACSN